MQKKILVVEDDPALLNVLSAKIKSLNYTVIEAKDGEEAMKQFKKELPDLVLLDIILPSKNGFEVLEEIKLILKSEVPIVILSNLSEAQDIETAKNLGAVDYITKSNLTLKEIMIKISKAIELKGENGGQNKHD